MRYNGNKIRPVHGGKMAAPVGEKKPETKVCSHGFHECEACAVTAEKQPVKKKPVSPSVTHDLLRGHEPDGDTSQWHPGEVFVGKRSDRSFVLREEEEKTWKAFSITDQCDVVVSKRYADQYRRVRRANEFYCGDTVEWNGMQVEIVDVHSDKVVFWGGKSYIRVPSKSVSLIQLGAE